MDNKILATIIAIFVGITLVGSVLMPTVIDASEVVGEPVTFTNVTNAVVDYKYDYLKNAEYTITVESDGSYTIDFNGTVIERKTDNFPIFFSDIGYSEGYSTVASDTIVNIALWDNEEDTQASFNISPSDVGTTTVTFSNGVCTLTKVDGTTYSLPYRWLMGITPNGDYITYTGSISPLYVVDVDNIITYSGKRAGEINTYYAYARGVGYAQGEYNDKISFDYVGGNLVEGTTDVYTGGNGQITIDGETFSPFRCLILEKVTGHEDDSISALVLVIPVFVIVALLGVGVSFIRTRY